MADLLCLTPSDSLIFSNCLASLPLSSISTLIFFSKSRYHLEYTRYKLIFKYNLCIIRGGDMQQLPLELKVTVGQIGHSLRVTIPKVMADTLGIKKGDVVGLSLTDGEIKLRKLGR